MSIPSSILAATAIALLVLGAGGVHTAVVGVACGLLIFALGLQARHLRLRDHDVVCVSAVGLGFGLLALASFVQLVPVPAFIHAILNREGLELTRTGLELAGAGDVGLRPLSLDPAETADRAIRFVTLAVAAVWGANLRTRRAWRTVGLFLVVLGFVTVGTGFGLQAAGGKSVYGFYESPVGFRGPSTFISLNHGAAYFGFTAICAVATSLGFRQEKPGLAAALGVAALVFVGLAIKHQSDGVLLALGSLPFVGAGLAWLRAGRPTTLPRDVAIGVGLLAIASAAAAVWLDIHRTVGGFLSRVVLSGEHGGRLELARAGAEAALDFWPFGAGAGSVGTVIPAYIDWSSVIAASVPVLENDTLELLFGFGFFVGGAAIVAFVLQVALAMRRAVDPTRSSRHIVAVVASVYVALIAQMHFPLFALGLGVPMIVWLETLWSRRMRSSHDAGLFASGHIGVSRLTVMGTAVVFGFAALAAAQAHYDWYDVELPDDPTAEEAARFIRTRPAAHSVYVRLATVAARRGEVDKSVRLAAHALSRERSRRVRLFYARAVALDDVELAAELYADLFAEGGASRFYVEAFLSDVRSPERRVDVVEGNEAFWLPTAQRILAIEGPGAASDFVVELATRYADRAEAYRVGTRLYLQMSQPTLAQLWAEHLRERERVGPADKPTAPYFMAHALHRAGKTDRAREVLDRTLESETPDLDASRFALRLRVDLDDAKPEEIVTIRGHHNRLCASPVPSGDLRLCWESEAWLAEAEGEYAHARRVMQRIGRRFDDPMPLGRLLARLGRCKELARYAQTRSFDARVKKRLEKLQRSCSSL